MPAMSKIANTAAVVAAAFVSQAAAHTYVKEFEAGGKTYAGFYAADKSGGDDSSPAWRTNQGWGFQPVYGDKINSPDIIAHIDAEPSPFTAPVDAGSDVKFTWQHDGECKGTEVGWDCSHHGWTATWLAPCNGDCASVNKEDLSFFKIHQAGLLSYPPNTRYSDGGDTENTGYWGTDAIFYDNGNTQTVTIPKDLPSGNYVLRTEVASVHNNGDISQRQLWPQALNIAIQNGNDNAQIPAGVKATEIYSASYEQLTFDLYQHEAGVTFDAPGPALAPCASGSDSSSGNSTASAPVDAPASTTAAAVPAESSYAAQPTSETEAIATTTQVAYVTATVSAPVDYNTPTAPEATAAPENDDESDDEEEEEDDDDEDDDESDDDDDDEDSDDDEEEGDNEHHGYGQWRNHARDFFSSFF